MGWSRTPGSQAIDNIGVVCIVMKLKKSVTPHFWINVVDSTLPIPGIIEFTNLRRLETGETVVYIPYYMPVTNPLWRRTSEEFIREALFCLKQINPSIDDTNLVTAHVGRLRHAQPICPPGGFKGKLPPSQTPIAGLQIADTCFYYPEDRGISESVKLGQEMARFASAQQV